MQSIMIPLFLSVKVAVWATMINLVLGIAFGWYLSRKRSFCRQVLDVMATLPMVLPPTVLGYYLLVLFGNKTGLSKWLEANFGFGLVFSLNGAIIAAAIVTFPLVFKPARAAFESVDEQLQQVGWVLGVSKSAVFFRVFLPLAWRGILAGLLLGFVRALGEFGATLMVAGSIPGKTQTLSIAIYDAVQAGQDAEVNQLVLLISVVCIAVLSLAYYLSPKRA
ncbi:molybdenum ABC transporter permease subunit [Advenella faeciporci]|uniref:Molybdenum transport system permease n=3 Tax=Advenella TaxID=290425 RepID=A0A918JNR3_9BURK|nr:molybdate ABC transporter permease subunit [Advenella alkanexedens]GGW90989.1 molybdenum ABC transporter permease subunit [Advenella faeciporci]